MLASAFAGSAIMAMAYLPWVVVALGVLLLVLVVGVVLPAVWSSKGARRKAALAVLSELRNWFSSGDRRA
jgi:Flp pilus assembly protein TadB